MIELEVLYEDNHCLAVNKPAGLLSQGDRTGQTSLVDVAALYLKTRYQKPGNVYVGLLHRLDRPASGVMILAKTSKAAGRLSEQFRSGTIAKLYWAIVEGTPPESAGTWTDVLTKDRRANRASAQATEEPAGKEALVDFRVLEQRQFRAKLELSPRSGRSHQLRVQLASRGFPILGDIKYGSKVRLRAVDGGLRIALHARQITFAHPTRAEPITIVAPVPGDWPESWPDWPESGCGSSRPAAGPRR
jgi:23S rRNA pseudouridine1911/1915/1917 synthase